MTKNRTNIISRCRNIILCFALVIYGLPITVMAAPSMMSSGMSHDMSVDQQCPETMTNHSEMMAQGDMTSSDDTCCDSGNCDYSCMGLSLAMITAPISYLTITSGTARTYFTAPLTAITLSGEQPPPQV